MILSETHKIRIPASTKMAPSCPIYSIHLVLTIQDTQADSWQHFEHISGSQPSQLLFRILLFCIYVEQECCSFQCLCKKGHEELPSCKTHFMTLSEKAFHSSVILSLISKITSQGQYDTAQY